MYRFDANGQLMMLELEAAEGAGAPPKRRPGKPDSELVSIPYFHLDLVSGSVDLFGQRHWELRSPWRKGKRPLNTGAAPRRPIRVPLSGILEANPAQKYYLSKVACIGILRRAFERGKELPKKLERALKIQAGLMRPDGQPTGLEAYHINQRDEGIDLHGVSGALLATTNMQMQTFVTQPDDAVEGFDGYNGDLTGDVAATLGVNCGMSTGRNGVMAFAANQRDEVRDLHDLVGALGAQPGMKRQTFIAAAFSAGQGSKAGSIDCQDELAYTLTATDRHCIYARQRVDEFKDGEVVSTQSARQYKDATDLICQQAEACAHLIRRLTPPECERLQGFPDGWTDIPGASDSARYKALGNSVAIPCVEFIMSRIAAALL